MRPPTVGKIQEVVARYYGLNATELTALTQNRASTRARHVCMYLARQYSQYSFPFLGRLFQRDHTAIMYGVRKIEERLNWDPKTILAVKKIKDILNAESDRGGRANDGDDAGAGGE